MATKDNHPQRLPITNGRLRKRESSIMGWDTRRSLNINKVSKASPENKPNKIEGLDQPRSEPLLIAISKLIIPAANRNAPTLSKLSRSLWGLSSGRIDCATK